jgi:rhodanese-related sulfurtransferase
VGQEKKLNYALQQQTKKDFILAVTQGLEEPPEYFPINARINKEGYDNIDELVAMGTKELSIEEFKGLVEKHAIILDTRDATVFTSGFIPGSINIGLEGRYAEWAGSLLPFDKPLVLVTEPGKEKESVVRLARVGFDKILGCLKNGFDAWKSVGENVDLIIDIEPDELAMDLPFDDNILVVDVRKPNEFAEGHIDGAINIPLNTMSDPGSMAKINDDDNLYVHCSAGYRSVIASSLLKREGFHNLRNVLGGWNKIKNLERVEIITEKTFLN